jgi:cysteinyl-tRNA synthetase
MSELQLFNTLTRSHEVFRPLKQKEVRMYCCGPTVYNYVHIGNLRTFLWGDVLRRYLEWKGYQVTQVMNFTDVDDRIIEHARKKGVDLDTYTGPYIEAFFKDIDTLRIRRANIYPRATRHIDEMVALVQKLSENGHTYVTEGSTYFRIATFPEYGNSRRPKRRPPRSSAESTATTTTRKMPATLCCGRRRKRMSRRGRLPSGTDGRDGIWSVPRCRCATWARPSTSTPARST